MARTKATDPETGANEPKEDTGPTWRGRPMNKFIAAERIAAILEQVPFAERHQVLSFVTSPRQPELPLGSA